MTKRYSYFNANMVGQLKRENKELKLQLEAFKDKLCELGVADEKLIKLSVRLEEVDEEE